MARTKRIQWIDIVKCLCCLAVIMAHVNDHKAGYEIKPFYSAFVLTGFFFVSGYTYQYREGFFEHVKKKGKQLFIPWLSLSLANILLSNILTLRPDKHIGLVGDLLRNFLQVRGYGDGIWFLNALFVAYLPFYFYIQRYEKEKQTNPDCFKKYLLIAVGLFFLNGLYTEWMPADIFPWKMNRLPWHLEYVPFELCFMYIGYLSKDRYSKILNKKEPAKVFWPLILGYVVIIYGLHYLDLSFPAPIFVCVEFIRYCLGIMAVVLISKRIPFNRYVRFVGQNSMLYFALQGKFISVWEKIFNEYLVSISSVIYNNAILSDMYVILFAFLNTLILAIPILLINRYLPFMAGKDYKK